MEFSENRLLYQVPPEQPNPAEKPKLESPRMRRVNDKLADLWVGTADWILNKLEPDEPTPPPKPDDKYFKKYQDELNRIVTDRQKKGGLKNRANAYRDRAELADAYYNAYQDAYSEEFAKTTTLQGEVTKMKTTTNLAVLNHSITSDKVRTKNDEKIRIKGSSALDSADDSDSVYDTYNATVDQSGKIAKGTTVKDVENDLEALTLNNQERPKFKFSVEALAIINVGVPPTQQLSVNTEYEITPELLNQIDNFIKAAEKKAKEYREFRDMAKGNRDYNRKKQTGK